MRGERGSVFSRLGKIFRKLLARSCSTALNCRSTRHCMKALYCRTKIGRGGLAHKSSGGEGVGCPHRTRTSHDAQDESPGDLCGIHRMTLTCWQNLRGSTIKVFLLGARTPLSLCRDCTCTRVKCRISLVLLTGGCNARGFFEHLQLGFLVCFDGLTTCLFFLGKLSGRTS